MTSDRVSDERLAYMIERQSVGYLTITTAEITSVLTELQQRRSVAVSDEIVERIATLFGNYIPGHGWTGFGPSPEAIVAALVHAEQHSEQIGYPCDNCGQHYDFDMLVPDDVWRQIKPDGAEETGGLLCPTCIGRRLSDIGWPCAKLYNPHAASGEINELDQS